MTLDATLGNINAPSVWIRSAEWAGVLHVVTYYDEKDVPRHRSHCLQLPGARSSTADAKPIALSAYADIRRAAGPIAIERDHMKRVTEVYLQTEGRDVGSVADELDQEAGCRSPDQPTSNGATSARWI